MCKRKAQLDIDMTHFYELKIPEKFHAVLYAYRARSEDVDVDDDTLERRIE